MSNNNFKYFFISTTDKISTFVKENVKGFVVFSLALIAGLVIGILSALKPVDCLTALSTHNGIIFSVIENAAYLSFIFGSLFTLLAIFLATSFLGRFAYSQILLIILTIVIGYFQGGTVVLVIRVYGFIAIPFVIVYSVTSIAMNLILFAHFVLLTHYASERKKYGCKTSFLKALLTSVYIFVAAALALIVKYILVILFSFFL